MSNIKINYITRRIKFFFVPINLSLGTSTYILKRLINFEIVKKRSKCYKSIRIE